VAGAGETEGGVGPAALVVHAGEHRDLGVDVVVDLDAGLGVGRSEDTADVLDNAALELDGKRQQLVVPVDDSPALGRRLTTDGRAAAATSRRRGDALSSLRPGRAPG
jgi:hypothetical protein